MPARGPRGVPALRSEGGSTCPDGLYLGSSTSTSREDQVPRARNFAASAATGVTLSGSRVQTLPNTDLVTSSPCQRPTWSPTGAKGGWGGVCLPPGRGVESCGRSVSPPETMCLRVNTHNIESLQDWTGGGSSVSGRPSTPHRHRPGATASPPSLTRAAVPRHPHPLRPSLDTSARRVRCRVE